MTTGRNILCHSVITRRRLLGEIIRDDTIHSFPIPILIPRLGQRPIPSTDPIPAQKSINSFGVLGVIIL